MLALEWSGEALADLADIVTYGRTNFGEPAAAQYLDRLHDTVDTLRRHPRSAPVRTDLTNDFHCKTYREHYLFYWFDDDALYVVRVLHQARQVSPRSFP